MKHFSCKTQIISGTGALEALKDRNISRLLLVSDPYFVKNGMAQALIGKTNASSYQIFDKIVPDPTLHLAAEGTNIVNTFAPDTIIALGGGSAIDCAKAMAYFSAHKAQFIAIPTTSGSGSEVTDFAILTHDGIKHPLVDKSLCPDVAILDSDLLTALPPSLIADTGFDVLCHALEAYVAKDACSITDALAREAFCTAYNLLGASFSGDISVRQKMHESSTMAGLAFTHAGLGLTHALAHALGGVFHLPHGRLNAILLPAVIDFNCPAAASRYAALSRSAGLGGSADTLAVRNLKTALISLRRDLGMPQNLLQAGADKQVLLREKAHIVHAVLSDPCCSTNPVVPDGTAVARILEAVTGNG